jgi:hypothetical protein
MNEGVFANLLCATVLIAALIVALGIFGRAMLEERQADRQHERVDRMTTKRRYLSQYLILVEACVPS